MNLHLCNNLQLKLRNNIGRNNLVALRELRFLILYIPHNRTQVLERVCIKCFHPSPPPATVSATTSHFTIPVAKSLVFDALVALHHTQATTSLKFFPIIFSLVEIRAPVRVEPYSRCKRRTQTFPRFESPPGPPSDSCGAAKSTAFLYLQKHFQHKTFTSDLLS